MRESEIIFYCIATAFVCCGLCAVVYRCAELELQREAVKRGHARWDVDENGSVTFAWEDETP